MIESAEAFIELRTSQSEPDYHRAAHDQLPEDVCRDIIDRFPDMRFWLAQNKTVPLTILHVLTVDPDHRVRFRVAQKRKLDHELFVPMAADSDETIRAQLPRNPKVPTEILHALAEDDSVAVRGVANDQLTKREEPRN